ncbi:MAG TPA: sugar ABC transporter substrate-binding protein, partial [Ktedonobacteraceae bacterium]|nr:sugar ABC transporter substrate-binding protein [Ktedonobacteraceae bacterium]
MRFFSSFPGRRRFAPGFAFVAVAFMLMLPLAACGGGTSSGSSATATGPVTLTYWAWIPNMDKQVALFNQTHPNIHVNLVNVGAGPLE